MLTMTGVLLRVQRWPARDGMPGQNVAQVEGVNAIITAAHADMLEPVIGQPVTVAGFYENSKYGGRVIAASVAVNGAGVKG